MDFFENKRRNYLKETLCLIESIFVALCISKFYEKRKSITIMDLQVEDWVIFAIQVSAKAKNRAKFKTKKNKEAKKK